MPDRYGSEYLHWAKTRKPAQFNLASSGVSPCSMAELGAALEDLEVTGPGLYGFAPLQQAIAAHCRVPAECVVATSGTSMANFIAMAALLEPGDEVLIEHPAYEPIIAAARYLGSQVKRFRREFNGRVEIALSAEMLTTRTKLVVITNLHNPTCFLLPEQEIRRIAALAKSAGGHLLVDEVYLECLYEKRYSAFHHGDAVVCTRSLTKAYGLGGLRCGWILAEPNLARRMWEIKDLIDPGAPHAVERLSVIAFRELNRLAIRARTLIDRNRALLLEFLHSCPHLQVSLLPEYGTCVFPRLKSGDSERLFEVLHRHYDTDVVPGRFFEMPDHFRLGIGGDSDTFRESLLRLQRALERLST